MPIDLADAVVDDFIAFMETQPARGEGERTMPLSSYFSAWATHGDAVDQCGGNYALYLRTFFYAIARFEEDRTVFGGLVPERIVSDDYWQTLPVIEPEDWQTMVYRRMRGLPAVPPEATSGRTARFD